MNFEPQGFFTNTYYTPSFPRWGRLDYSLNTDIMFTSRANDVFECMVMTGQHDNYRLWRFYHIQHLFIVPQKRLWACCIWIYTYVTWKKDSGYGYLRIAALSWILLFNSSVPKFFLTRGICNEMRRCRKSKIAGQDRTEGRLKYPFT